MMAQQSLLADTANRDFLLYRILSGKLAHPRGFFIVSPSVDLLYEGSVIYKRYYDLALEQNIYDDKGIKKYLIKMGKWTEKDENNLTEILPKHIDYWKEELFNAYFNSSKQETLRNGLKTARDEYNRLNFIRHSFDHITANGIANYAKLQFLIEKTTVKDGKPYDWDDVSLYNVMMYYQENLISEEVIRFLSHNQPWSITWSVGQKTKNLFGKPAIELTFEQQRLAMWSSLYDSVRESTSCPPDEIIDDDDVLDGWLIVERKKGEKNRDYVAENEKINSADEIYIPVTDTYQKLKDPSEYVKDAERIDNLNSNYNKALKKQRFKTIQQKGQINEQNLLDIREDIMIQYNNLKGK